MKRALLIITLLFCAGSTKAYTSGMAIRTDRAYVVQVFVNGKLYNKTPSNFIRIKSTEGTFHLKVKILNLSNHTWQEIRKTVHIQKGFEYYYKLVQKEGLKPELNQIRRYPIYSRYFLDYSLYTRGTTS